MSTSEMSPSPPAPRLISPAIVEEWSHLLPDPERSAFVRDCTEAPSEDGQLQPILARFFSTWKTNLMADDRGRLQLLAKYVQIQDYVKVIRLEDDYDEDDWETPPSESSVIWPRHEDGQVIAEALGVGILTSMLVTRQLRPDRLEIRDIHNLHDRSDPETAAILARIILDGADLAATAFILQKQSTITTMITAELSPEHQGQGTGFSILRKAELLLSHDLNSYWAEQILLHAPALKELTLSFAKPRYMPHTPPFILDNKGWPALEKLKLSSARLYTPIIMVILSNSHQSLTGISFNMCTLGNNSTWMELFTRIGNEFPHLTWFKVYNLLEHPVGEDSIRISFLGLQEDSVVIEPYRTKLVFRRRGGPGHDRIPGVEYEGPDASHVLRIVAEFAKRKKPSSQMSWP